ncbi:MtrAB system histidine kinase MtrB [Schaalia sp. Marseille-Q2122]|uniref:MtrAB system histidine kinase MtrB n=1 Tax=Schaalia sp. Marseille-Q2122 TaxID=2736604 RepID=UPI00158E003A|nr:MtrAB system histidine kinase MtrB [Schaalia sp. Marseille-Q2122]
MASQPGPPRPASGRDAKARGVLARLGTYLTPLRERLRRHPLVQRLRSSLSLRIALSITATAIIVLTVSSVVVSSQLTDSMFETRRVVVLEDASVRFSSARSSLEQSTASSPDQVQEVARQIVENIQFSAAGAGAVSAVLLRSPEASSVVRINEIIPANSAAIISDELRQAVQHSGQAHWQSILIPATETRPEAPGIITGTQVILPRAGAHELYIVYSLAADQAMVYTTLQVLTIAVLPIVLLLPFGVFFGVYQLLRPVRRTAEAASGLAAGNLDTRVPVEGNDEMARLGHAFNDMAASLQRQISEYDELSQLQQRFVTDVSHELRTPLTTIRMAEEMIWDERDELTPSGRRSAELLHGQVERFESMLADLLEISRHDAQSALLEAESTDMRSIVSKVVEANAELAKRLGVEVRVHQPEERCAAEVDARRMERVLRNLLVNAIEHADGSAVDIHLAGTDTGVAVRVCDYGVGMTEETAARVFDRFFRADPARARTTGGTGLGLSIAAEDVHLHNGLLSAYGEPGKGASFLMVIPRRVSEDPGPSPLAIWEGEQ